MTKPRLSFWQIWNMSFGFLGIQFGWGLQMANMSSIYEELGANADKIPLLWLAAPITGLIVQPIIGHMSDRTWCRLGRRRPYFLTGTIFATLALIAMPHSTALWMAACLLWVLDASVNISMEPFRAFVADKLPDEQRTAGFAVQSLFIGLGAVVASALPFILTNVFGIKADDTSASGIPLAVRVSFYIGAAVYFIAVLYTIVTTKEYPPDDLEAFEREKKESAGIGNAAKEIFHSLVNMPHTMRRLALVQFFTWIGLFCMWIYFAVAVAHNDFHGEPGTPAFTKGTEWGGVCFSIYNAVTFIFSFVLIAVSRKLRAKTIHTLCLVAGGIGLCLVPLISDKYLLFLPMVGVGIAWASIVSMPYAMLSGCLPQEKMGFYMGVFNFFIVIPQIITALFLGAVVSHVFNDNRMAAVVVGGVCLLIASGLTQLVRDGRRKTEDGKGFQRKDAETAK